MLHVGLFLLRLPPSEFWALTPLEFSIITGATRPAGLRMQRAALETLMQHFPDGRR